ncbi:major pollen allergen Lig v 1 [Tripterygium wilfordii]|uniref:Major pollen allergen Lig v 1 n=1 Tax=Tripterygium wilfordii TaxID=458696 RepID=A0A7J7DRC1_TRIWF|nr:pollen-specific protein-like At4g18596 [Tripterygium wilfordii]XP_038699072.1 pollen-specific protein-like At4g18596 [Tripterygium wilfordii]KAF5748681.1 major pollen allergen Lig v 1 [Tripterygium wilfordii]KAF5748704.1 major pollen allergen Lig v 1 [Tripterygium wilfordii]
MTPIILFFLSSLFMNSLSLETKPANINSRITVMGFVYCDICSNNSFSKHSYFLPGAEVKIDCKFRAISSKTREQISFSVNRTTNKHGVYKLEIPSVDGIQCAEAAIASSCQASLMWSSSAKCNVPGYRTTSDEIVIKSKQANLCIYSLTALNFRPSKININLCRN